MKTIMKRFIYIYCMNVALFAIAIFLHGFFPVRSIMKSHSGSDIPMEVLTTWLNVDEIYEPKVDKLVIMIIDAIRYDFVHSEHAGSNLPYLYSLFENHKACLFKLKADAPTVTMPRLKAITSGAISNFFDVILNFGSSEIGYDNFIDQAKSKYNVVFYGDDTWLKLFPNRFIRSEGITSFFVTDYTQVDLNVTRNLQKELKRSDWEVLILHYLGLDHIGHLEGPRSKLVKPKLNEMDAIIKLLHTHLLKLEEFSNESTMLMILGDHGMADTGSHGGTSDPEVSIPLVSIGLGCHGIYGRLQPQVNLASTLSVLLGLPIPVDNTGAVITELLKFDKRTSNKYMMFVVFYNAYQLVAKYLQNGGTVLDDGYKLYWHAQYLHAKCAKTTCSDSETRNVISTYERAITLMSVNLLTSTAEYHFSELSISIVILIQVLIIVSFGVELTTSSLRKCLTPYKVFALFSIAIMLWWSNLLTLTCVPFAISIFINVLIVFILMLNTFLIANCQMVNVFTCLNDFKSEDKLCHLILFGTILQVISTISTSFIEFENVVWYHTFMLILVVATLQSVSTTIINDQLISDSFYTTSSLKKGDFPNWIGLLVVHRILMSYRECFINLITDQDNIIYTSLISAAGLASIWWWLCVEIPMVICHKHQYSNNLIWSIECVLISACLVIIYYYRAVTGAVKLPFKILHDTRGVAEVNIFFAIFLILSLVKCYKVLRYMLRTSSSEETETPKSSLILLIDLAVSCWLLMASLLMRPYMIWLIAMMIFTCSIVGKLVKSNIMYLTIIYYWIGSLFYFYQGNSNQIVSIDITPGYVGQSSYNATIAGLFISIHTFCFPILAYLLLLFHVFYRDPSTHVTVAYKGRSLLMLTHLAWYSIIITLQRYHLFIWSVFAPKLLYLVTHSIIIIGLFWFTELVLGIDRVLCLLSR